MKNFFIIIIICFLLNFQKINNTNTYQTIYKEIIDNIGVKVNKIIDEMPKHDNISNCLNIMGDAYHNKSKYNYGYLTKLFYDSSPNFEDIKNYYKCYNNLYMNVDRDILDNLTYVVIQYQDKYETNDTEYENSFNSFSKIFGVCLPKGCSNEEYFEIIKNINVNYNLIEGNITSAISLKSSKKYTITEKIYQLIIPFLLLTFILIIIGIKYISGLFWSFFGYIFLLCNKKKYDNENIQKIIKRNKPNQIEALNAFIKLSNNIEEVMPGSKESQISNENGLQIVVGLRGIFIIGLFLGLTLQNIFTTPTRIFTDRKYRKYMDSKLYCILFFFARISQKMLYALSGFELTFKLLFYFDNCLFKKTISHNSTDLNNTNLNKSADDTILHNSIALSKNSSKNSSKKNSEKNSEKIITNNLESFSRKISSSSKINSKSKSKSNKTKSSPKKIKQANTNSNSINEEEEDYEDNEEEESDEFDEDDKKKNLINQKKKKDKTNSKNNNAMLKKFISSIDRGQIYINNKDKLTFKSLLSFHLRQSYLYFIFFFSIMYFIFCQTKIIAHFFQDGTLWMIITSEVEKNYNPKIILGTIFLYAGTCSEMNIYNNFFIPAMNEIFFYLFGTTIIYIYYKKNARLDLFLIFMILFVMNAKLIIFLIMYYINDNNNNLYFPSLDFMQLNNYYLIQMHLLNLSYYCLGMIVGLANYALQNNTKKKKIVKEFVKVPRKLYFIIKRKYNFIFGLAVFILFLIIDVFLYKFYLLFNNNNKNKAQHDSNDYFDKFFKNIIINIFYLFDCELIIACIFILTIIVFYSSHSFLRDNFNAYPWKILSRVYFPLLFTAPMQSNWFLLQFAERIDLNIVWVLYVLTLIFILSVGVSIAIYVFFQVPLKKITKIIYVEKNNIIDELQSLANGGRSLSYAMSETSSIDLSENTKVFVNGRKASDSSNDENDIIRSDLELVIEKNDDIPFNEI